jgi:hypothetical protein
MRSFSPSFRDRHEEEMLDTLLEQRFEQTPTERLGGDIDLVRNGLAQRLGAATIEDLRAAVRVSSLFALTAGIGLSIVLLTRLQNWSGPTLTHPWPKVVWIAMLASALGELFLPRALSRLAWLGGVVTGVIAFIYASSVSELPQIGDPVRPVSLSTSVLVVTVLLALGGWARSTSLPARTGAAAAGTAVGVGLVLRVDALLHAPSSGAISAAYFDQVHADFRLDLLHLDLAPGFGTLAVGSLLALALAGWFHSRAAAIALTLIVPISIVAVATHSLRSVPLRWTLIADLVVAAIAVAALGRGSRSSRMSFDRRQP